MEIASLKDQMTSRKYFNDLTEKTSMMTEKEMQEFAELKRAKSEAMEYIAERWKKKIAEMCNKELAVREEKLKLMEVSCAQREEQKQRLEITLSEKQRTNFGWYVSGVKESESEELFEQISGEWGMYYEDDGRR